MSYKKFLWNLLFVFFLLLMGMEVIDYLVDPIGIWGSPIIKGFNHYKVRQSWYLDIYKPYEYMREKPDVLYVGGSQCYTGFKPESKAYTMGLPSLSLQDMREQLQFIYKVHKPKIMYMGLFSGQFMKKNYSARRERGFAQRLERMSGNWGEYCLQLISDTMSLHDVTGRTIWMSRLYREDDQLFIRGWDRTRGAAKTVNPVAYYHYLYAGNVDENELKMDPDAMDCLRNIICEANDADVSMVVFFLPCSIDWLALNSIVGGSVEVQRIKRMVASIVPVYDFCVVSELTTNRQAYFYDIVHFRASLGEQLRPILEGKATPEPYGYLLTPETADTIFAVEKTAWEKWREENKEYVQALTECIESGRKPQVGDFEKYIGF